MDAVHSPLELADTIAPWTGKGVSPGSIRQPDPCPLRCQTLLSNSNETVALQGSRTLQSNRSTGRKLPKSVVARAPTSSPQLSGVTNSYHNLLVYPSCQMQHAVLAKRVCINLGLPRLLNHPCQANVKRANHQPNVKRHANLCRPQLSPEQITRFRGFRQGRPLWHPQQLLRHPASPASQLCITKARHTDCRIYDVVPMGVPAYIQNVEPTGLHRPPPES